MAGKVLVVNAGSSSLKFKLFQRSSDIFTPLVSGLAERIGDLGNSQLVVKDLRDPHNAHKTNIKVMVPQCISFSSQAVCLRWRFSCPLGGHQASRLMIL